MMNLDNYEKVDIEINTPADIYRAMLDGYYAEFKTEENWNIYNYAQGWFPEMPELLIQNIQRGYWSIWRVKPKPQWYELAKPEKPVICRYLPTGYFALYVNMAHDWNNFNPLTDAEIDQLKRGL